MSDSEFIDVQTRFHLTDEEDHHILLFRDAHFHGDFDIMINFLKNHDVSNFSTDRIHYLQSVEKTLGHDLAPLLLTAEEAEQVFQSRKSYIQLREIYENSALKNSLACLIADLILHEDEDFTEPMSAIIAQGKKAIPSLLSLIQDDRFYNIYFPGYGKAPLHAITCLGKIKDPSIIPHLFNLFGQVEEENCIINAFYEIGNSAKTFLLKILSSRPISQDNVHAALALAVFDEDEEIINTAFQELPFAIDSQNTMLISYLCNLFCTTRNTEKQAFFKKEILPKLSRKICDNLIGIVRNWH